MEYSVFCRLFSCFSAWYGWQRFSLYKLLLVYMTFVSCYVTIALSTECSYITALTETGVPILPHCHLAIPALPLGTFKSPQTVLCFNSPQPSVDNSPPAESHIAQQTHHHHRVEILQLPYYQTVYLRVCVYSGLYAPQIFTYLLTCYLGLPLP